MDNDFFYCDGILEYADGSFEAVMVNDATGETYFCEPTEKQVAKHLERCDTCRAYIRHCECEVFVDLNGNVTKVKKG